MIRWLARLLGYSSWVVFEVEAAARDLRARPDWAVVTVVETDALYGEVFASAAGAVIEQMEGRYPERSIARAAVRAGLAALLEAQADAHFGTVNVEPGNDGVPGQRRGTVTCRCGWAESRHGDSSGSALDKALRGAHAAHRREAKVMA